MMQLASEGVILERLYAAPWCAPSRASLLSGRFPLHAIDEADHGGALVPSFGVPDGMTLLPQKLKDVGYATHAAGKWHLGHSTFSKLPRARGFDTWLGYLTQEEDHYTKELSWLPGIRDFWLQKQGHDGPAPEYVGHDGDVTSYGDAQFSQFVADTLEVHPTQQPVFLYVGFQNPHGPMQVPKYVREKLPHVSFQDFGAQDPQLLGMVSFLDSVLLNITDVLKRRGMWQHTLFIFSSDHGKATGNYPLTGQKYTVFEGGVRVASFASGGLIPAAVRGTRQTGYIHMADWYATACELAGADLLDASAEANGLPAVDSVSVWPLLSGTVTASPRQEMPFAIGSLGEGHALISGPYKLILGSLTVERWAPRCIPQHVGCPIKVDMNCSAGCLYDIIADPEELYDLASKLPAVKASMLGRLAEFKKTVLVFDPSESDSDLVQKFWSEHYGGFVGPWPQGLG